MLPSHARWSRPSYLPAPDAPPVALAPLAAPAPLAPPRFDARRGALNFLTFVGLLVLSALLYTGAVALYVCHNDAPLASHPDEPGKVEQLLSDTRNYNHPMLMLETAKRLIPGLPQSPPIANILGLRLLPANPQTVVEQARGVSARFAAASAVLLALAGFAAAGWTGFVLLGVGVGLCPSLLAHAHFFKEDPALVFGLAFMLCAGAWALRARSPGAMVWTIVGLGLGVGLAASGKYAGAALAGPAAVAAVCGPLRRRQIGLALAGPVLVVCVAATAWAIVNYRVFDEFGTFLASFEYEKQHSILQHNGITMDRPNGYFTALAWADAMPHVKALAVIGVGLVGWRMGRRQAWGFGVWMILTLGVYASVLAYSVIPFFRYTLPLTVMLYAFAALAAAWLASLPRGVTGRIVATVVMVALLAGLQGERCADYTRQFADDSRVALRAWFDANVPAGTPVVADHYAELSNGRSVGLWFVGNNTPARVYETFQTGGNTVASLRASGIRYVVTAGTSADRYLSPHTHGAPGYEPSFNARQRFYQELQACPVAWSRVATHPMRTFANPDLVVYRIDGTP